jgi:hypothetical protein
VEFVGVVVVGLPGVPGAVVSTTAEPELENVEAFPTVSVAFTRKNHVPSVSKEFAYEVEFIVAVFPEHPVYEEFPHHWTVYAGLTSPVPESDEAVQDHVGELLFVGVVVVGVPGTDGAVASTITVEFEV